MLFDSVKDQCTLEVLRILNKGITYYSDLFKRTKVSHITLQNVLKDLLKKEFIYKLDPKEYEKGFGVKGYGITEEGVAFLKQLEKLKKIIE